MVWIDDCGVCGAEEDVPQENRRVPSVSPNRYRNKTAESPVCHQTETYRQKFRTVTIPAGENPAETYHRLKGLYRRWIRPEQHTKEQIGEQIILEQLLRVFPADIRTWVKEHEPTEGLAAAKLAQQYLNARRGGPAPYQGGPGRQTPAQTSSARVHTQQSPDSNHAASQRGPGKDFFATIAAPLTALTMKDQRNPVVWNEDCETAFQALKSCLCSSPVLRSPDFEQRFLVQTDASAVGLGAVLAQGDPGEKNVLYGT
uniref:SCAN box domain-containing protein n=1 Tax=Knipowitschia caucasica TaxID=637954 RepID=A0AAV2KNH7_KNICA